MNENKNKILLVIVVIVLLIVVLCLGVFTYKDKNEEKDKVKVNLSQLYVSDYEILRFDKYFIEILDHKIYGIVNDKGEEIYLNETGISYNDIYKTKDDKILFYNIINNNLNVYLFNGNKIEKKYTVEKIDYIKPLILQGNEDIIVGFVQVKDDGFDIFNLENNIPVNVDNLKLIGDYYKNDIYYTNTNSLVVADASNKFGVINFQGEEIIDCKYNNIISTINGNYVVQDEKDNYGIISVDSELVKPKYEMIIPFKNNYLMVRQGKMALFDNNYDNVTGFVFDYHEKEYDLHNSSTMKINTLGNYKMLIDEASKKISVLKNNKILLNLDQEYVYVKNKIYIYNEKMISIYDSEFNKETEIKLNEDIKDVVSMDSVYDNIIKINYVNSHSKNKEVYYDVDGNKVDMKRRKFILQKNEYLLFLTKEDSEKVLEVISNEKEVLHTIKANKIKVYDEYVIADKTIYKITVNK